VEQNGRLIPAVPVEVADVCGAGDTFLAALAYGYLEHKDMQLAIEFAMQASAVTVQHVGVYAPTIKEIKQEKS
jgi:sugar/nucleoside kinase (ribokinase family)